MNNKEIIERQLTFDVKLKGLSTRKVGTYQLHGDEGLTHTLENAKYIVFSNVKEDFTIKIASGCKFNDDGVHTDTYTTIFHVTKLKNCVYLERTVEITFSQELKLTKNK